MPSSPAYCPRGWFLHLRLRHGCLVSGLPSPVSVFSLHLWHKSFGCFRLRSLPEELLIWVQSALISKKKMLLNMKWHQYLDCSNFGQKSYSKNNAAHSGRNCSSFRLISAASQHPQCSPKSFLETCMSTLNETLMSHLCITMLFNVKENSRIFKSGPYFPFHSYECYLKHKDLCNQTYTERGDHSFHRFKAF